MSDADLAIQQMFSKPEERFSLLNALLVEQLVDPDDFEAILAVINDAESNPSKVRVLSIMLAPELAEIAQERDGVTDLSDAYLRLRQKAEGTFPTA